MRRCRQPALYPGETPVIGPAWSPVQRDAHVTETWLWVMETGTREAFTAMRAALPAETRPKLGNYVAIAWLEHLQLRWWA